MRRLWMDEYLNMTAIEILNTLLPALRNEQLKTLAYQAEAERLRAELERVRRDEG